MYKLPQLTYSYDALEPFIDKETMKFHHDKHHQAYVDKLNDAIKDYPELQKKDVQHLLMGLDKVPEKIRQAVKNHGGGHYNHSFFWEILKKDEEIHSEVEVAIVAKFGSLDKFKEKFKEAGMGVFGSGWVWLVCKGNELEIMTTANQDTPLGSGKIPVITLDLWEHAYYLKYQNKRADYIDAFFHVINWSKVNEHFCMD